ncbi:MAG: hypothetical protein IPK35_04810 [Saprospiraceae bacterium]|jgi:hypothetical protein|nr:hypothetical protein [Saprospiraceae bacterium]
MKNILLIITSLFIFGLESSFSQTTKNWIGGSPPHVWSNGAFWSPAGVPTVNDIVIIAPSSVTSINIDVEAWCHSLETSNNASLNINQRLNVRPGPTAPFGIANSGVIIGNAQIDIEHTGMSNSTAIGIHNRHGGIFSMNPGGWPKSITIANLATGIHNEYIFRMYGGLINDMTYDGIKNVIPNNIDSLTIKHDPIYNPFLLNAIGGHPLYNNKGKMVIEARVDMANSINMQHCILFAENGDMASSLNAEIIVRAPNGEILFPHSGFSNTIYGACVRRNGIVRVFGSLGFSGHTLSINSNGAIIAEPGGSITGY